MFMPNKKIPLGKGGFFCLRPVKRIARRKVQAFTANVPQFQFAPLCKYS
jgi:hypothetical protein